MKRTLKGTYVSVEPFHLIRYVDEQVSRYNTRQDSDGDRMSKVVESVVGRCITYNELIGVEAAP